MSRIILTNGVERTGMCWTGTLASLTRWLPHATPFVVVMLYNAVHFQSNVHVPKKKCVADDGSTLSTNISMRVLKLTT